MKCIIKNCTREACVRGLCWSDYYSARRKIGTDKESWDKLVAAGFALPVQKRGRKPSEISKEIDRINQQNIEDIKKELKNKKIQDLPGQLHFQEVSDPTTDQQVLQESTNV